MDLRIPSEINRDVLKEIKDDLLTIILTFQNSQYKNIVIKTWFICNQKNGKIKSFPQEIKNICDIKCDCLKKGNTPYLNKMIFKINCKEEVKINYVSSCILSYK